MKVISGISKINKKIRRPIVAIGIFDGVHRGHKFIIGKVIKKAKSLRGTSVVLTFDPHPVNILKPRSYLPLLISLEHRIRLFNSLKVDIAIIERFSKNFSQLSPEDFVKKLFVKKIRPKEVFVGGGFTFGKGGRADVDLLKRMGERHNFKVREISPVKIGKEIISSTSIRRFIQKGNLKKANRFLGRGVSILGRVMRGKARGRILGFPTANIYPCGEVTPPPGIYATRVIFNKKIFCSMTFIGKSPTFDAQMQTMCANIEVYIFNFNHKIYNRYIEIEFLEKMRNVRKFSSQNRLREQIQRDKIAVEHFFKASHKK